MWLEKLNQIIHLKKLRKEDMAKVADMSRTGFYQSLDAGSIKFEAMLKIMKYYGIDYYDLTEEEYSNKTENHTEYDYSYKSNKDINKLIEKLKENYEIRIKKCEEYNEHLKSQINFLQQLIAKSNGLGETSSNAG